MDADGRTPTGFIHVRGSFVRSGVVLLFERLTPDLQMASEGGNKPEAAAKRRCTLLYPCVSAAVTADLRLSSSCFRFHHGKLEPPSATSTHRVKKCPPAVRDFV